MHKDSVTVFDTNSFEKGFNLQIENCKNMKSFADKVYIQENNKVLEIKENTKEQ